MCGRFTILTYDEIASVAEAVEQRLEPPMLASPETHRPQAFPGSTIPLIASGNDGSLEIADAVWGFQTEWSKRLVFNTRIESAASGMTMWRNAAENGRCIVPVASFFEPHATETVPNPRTGRPMKRPYEFSNPSGAPLLLAGLRENGRCSIVTCEPNEWVAPIHNRMPLVLRFQEVGTWLSPDWTLLAERDDVGLNVQPEQLQQPTSESQLSLF